MAARIALRHATRAIGQSRCLARAYSSQTTPEDQGQTSHNTTESESAHTVTIRKEHAGLSVRRVDTAGRIGRIVRDVAGEKEVPNGELPVQDVDKATREPTGLLVRRFKSAGRLVRKIAVKNEALDDELPVKKEALNDGLPVQDVDFGENEVIRAVRGQGPQFTGRVQDPVVRVIRADVTPFDEDGKPIEQPVAADSVVPQGPNVPRWISELKVQSDRLVVTERGHVFNVGLAQLRDACQCAKCVDPSSKQRDFRSSDIPETIGVENIEVIGRDIAVTWKHDVEGYEGHRSTYSKDDLVALNGRAVYRWNRGGPVRIDWDNEVFERNQAWITYDDYMNDHEKFKEVMRSLRRYGLVFVKDIPEDVESVSRVSTRMGPIRDSFYGKTWDVRSIPQAINVAYTNKFLGFHMDLMYMADPPAYQLLHCLRNSLAGGESLFSDSFRAVNSLMQNEPELYEVLCRFPVRFGYHNNGQHYEYIRPVIERPFPNKKPSLFTYVNYSPPFQLPILGPVGLGGKSREETVKLWTRAMRAFAREMEDPRNMFELKLQEGECVIFANRRVVHARRGFDLSAGVSVGADGEATADRWLRGAYVDEDALLSQFDALREENWTAWDATTLKDGMWLGEMQTSATTEMLEDWNEEAAILEGGQ